MSTSRKKLTAEERREATIKAVLELAGEHNPGDITTAAIAQHMNLTQGALFRHFQNKEAIWQAVMDWLGARFLKKVDLSVQETSSALAALEKVFMTHIEFVSEHPGVPRMMLGELQRSEETPAKITARQMLKEYGERVSNLLNEGIESGDIHADLDVVAARIQFIGSIQGLVVQSLLAGQIENMKDKALGVFEIYRRGIEKLK